jgi:hypothetical protein
MAHHFHTGLSEAEITGTAGELLASENGLVCEFPGQSLANLISTSQ